MPIPVARLGPWSQHLILARMKRGRQQFVSSLPTVGGMQVVQVRATGSRRPVDKQLVVISKDGINATQQTTVLATVTFPCTIVGLRWDMAIFQDAGTGTSLPFWNIMIVKDGVTIPTMSVGDGGDFVTPEQNVMVFGAAAIDNNVESFHWQGTTKTMRKMQNGDQLIFALRANATNTVGVRGVIQFFCKT